MFSKISTTSIIAIIFTIGSLAILGFLAVKYGDDPTTRTQIITGIFGACVGGVTGFYFSSSKQHSSATPGTATVDISATTTTTTDPATTD